MDDSTALALPGAVRWPPADLAAEPDSPFDLATFFSPVPKSENAAPLYLDALSDFDLGMAACFPEDQWAAVHERALRRQEKLAQIFDPATGQAAVWVNADTIDRVLDAYKVGFEKLRRAQERPRCAFELGPTASAELPHAFAARQVVTIARLRHNRDVQRGNLVRPIETVGIILRLARDLQPRASLMCQIVAVALELNSRELVLEILRLPDLRVDHVDLLLGVLERHELDALPHPLAEGHSVEYVYARTGLRDLEHRTGDYSPEGFRRLGPGFGSEIKTLGEFAVRCGKLLVGTNPNSGPERTAEEIDRQLNGMGPDDFKREAQHIKEYYEKLIAVSKRPFQNQVANFPKPLGFYLNLPGASPPYPLIWTRPLAGLRLVRCLAAMRRWQLTETTAPPNLETVVRAAGLNAVPDDPFGDRPIRMAWVANEPVV